MDPLAVSGCLTPTGTRWHRAGCDAAVLAPLMALRHREAVTRRMNGAEAQAGLGPGLHRPREWRPRTGPVRLTGVGAPAARRAATGHPCDTTRYAGLDADTAA